ncbi:hypothetical protein ABPG77_002875 [Micractinium sp. CCAP 211/92]
MRLPSLPLLFGLLAAAGAAAKPTRCVQDQGGCVQCSANGINCVACDVGYVKVNGACTKCLARMTEDGLMCDKCDKSNLKRCQRCFYSYDPDVASYPTKDGSCALSQVNNCNKAAPVTGRCLQCAAGFFLRKGQCVTCTNGCTSCDALGRCQACIAGRGLDRRRPFGLVCKMCASNRCDNCDGNVNKCKKCGLGYGLARGACRKCKDPMCAICNGAGACLKCLPGLAAVRGSCKPCSDPNCVSCPRATDHCLACQNGRYADRKTGKCVACAVFNCDACNSANAASCDECTLGYNRVPMPSGDFKCLKQLPAGRASFPN